MIKRGSGIALCLKFVTNKGPLFPPLVVKRTHVSVCARAKNPLKSSLFLQCFGGHRETTSVSALDYQTLGDCVLNQFKVIHHKCDSDVIRHISYLIFDSKDSTTPGNILNTTLTNSHCQLNASRFRIPFYGTLNDAKLSHTCDLKSFHNLSQQASHPGTLFYPSSSVKQSLPLDNSNKDQHLHWVKSGNNDPQDSFKPPSEEQLALVLETLVYDLPRFFHKSLDYKIYHPNIVLEDNIREKRFSGLNNYNLQAKLLYIGCHLRFAYIKLDILKITSHPEDGTIKVRWRISVLRVRRLWKVKIWNFSTSLQNLKETWIDGFSTYYVMGDGLVHRHVADKMIPDPEQLIKKDKSKPIPVANPLAYSGRTKV